LAASLQLLCLSGGLGYLYLGQYRRGFKLLGLVLLLQLLAAVASNAGVYTVGMALAPVVFSLQALSALDAWLLARSTPGPKQFRVQALAWL
jgi:TM2 domain-containing membrane protein YozV